MRRVVLESEVNEKRKCLREYNLRFSDSVSSFIKNANNVNEVIEALKICANTYGGLKRTGELSNLDFGLKSLDNAKGELDLVKIDENFTNAIVSESEL